MGHAAVTAFVCVSCRGKDNDAERPGRRLFDAITGRLGEGDDTGITVTPVECLAVCKRPCTVALAAPGRWTYVVGDLHPQDHVDDLIAMALRYGTSSDGIVPWRERPQSFRKGVVCRIPPLGFRPAEP
jgi:predicted metal-binding protein